MPPRLLGAMSMRLIVEERCARFRIEAKSSVYDAVGRKYICAGDSADTHILKFMYSVPIL